MYILIIMVVSSEMKNKSDCYVKVIKKIIIIMKN